MLKKQLSTVPRDLPCSHVAVPGDESFQFCPILSATLIFMASTGSGAFGLCEREPCSSTVRDPSPFGDNGFVLGCSRSSFRPCLGICLVLTSRCPEMRTR